MAIAEAHLTARFGDDLVDHRTYVLASDGDLMEGISQEAITLAGHLRLKKLIVLFDDNGISIDGPTSLADSVDQVKRFKAAGWSASRIDGHDPDAIAARSTPRRTSDRPSMIACRTIIGYGAPTKAGTAPAHGRRSAPRKSPARARRSAGPTAPFDDSRRHPRRTGAPPASAARQHAAAWSQRLQALAADKRADFEGRIAGKLPAGLAAAVRSREAASSPRRRRPIATPHGLGARARSDHRRDAGDGRRIGRPHRLQQHPHQGDEGDVGRPTMPAATSTTACASTAWPRR